VQYGETYRIKTF